MAVLRRRNGRLAPSGRSVTPSPRFRILVSYETVRRWVNHFGPKIAADLRKRRPKPHTIWHLDEVYLKIDGRLVYFWRAVDAEGEVLDVLVQT
jgi:putative transposase